MKDSHIALALAAVAVFLIVKSQGGKFKIPSVRLTPGTTDQVTEILNNGSAFGNGWRYFSDGTSIGPDGSYYSGSQKVWSAS